VLENRTRLFEVEDNLKTKMLMTFKTYFDCLTGIDMENRAPLFNPSLFTEMEPPISWIVLAQ
jgi:hypothetical protein